MSLFIFLCFSKAAEDSGSPGVSVVRELVHSFLLDLCCSYKYGISFHDASFGTAGRLVMNIFCFCFFESASCWSWCFLLRRAGNLVLLQFLVGLKQATEDQLVADLVVNVLKTSPDILSRYFRESQYSYIPRPRGTWQENVKLLKKVNIVSEVVYLLLYACWKTDVWNSLSLYACADLSINVLLPWP